MDADAEFEAVRRDIAEGRLSEATAKIGSIAESADDPLLVIKCISLQKAVGGDVRKLVDRLPALTGKDPDSDYQVAAALLSLGFPSEAYRLTAREGSDRFLSLSARCLLDMGDSRSALEAVDKMESPSLQDRCLRSEALSAVGDHEAAVSEARRLLIEHPSDYGVQVRYVSALLSAGRKKEALKHVRDGLKDKTADANALAGYVMWVSGNVKSAGAYASRAVQSDPKHIGAMEVLGLCLAEKGETSKARIVAGAINEASPGDKAAVRIVSYCEMKERSRYPALPSGLDPVDPPQLLPERRREEHQGGQHLQTADPHEDHHYRLHQVADVPEAAVGSEVSEGGPQVPDHGYGYPDGVLDVEPAHHDHDRAHYQGGHEQHEDGEGG